MRVDYLQDLVEHWRTRYDWRAHEAQINALPIFTTTIDGQRGSLHSRLRRHRASDAADPYPGSIVEFLPMAPLNDAGFRLVIPSLPGIGLSGPTASHRGRASEFQSA